MADPAKMPPGAFKFVVNPFQPNDIIIVSPALYQDIAREWLSRGGSINQTPGIEAMIGAIKNVGDAKDGAK